MGAPEKRKAPGGKTGASQQSVSNDENSERNTDQHTTTQAPVNVRIANIQRDGSAQMRAAGTDPATVTEYADAMRDGAVFPPITVYFDGETHWPADGFHRIEAAALIKAETILAEVRHGNRRDAILAAAGANAAHGLRRTAADRRRAIESLLRDPEWTGWSDREIGKTCCADHKTVGKIRRELTGEIPSDRTYRDRHGNTSIMKMAARTADTGKPGSMTEKLLQRLPDTQLLAECQRRGWEVSK